METVYIDGFDGYYIDMYNQNGKIVTWDNGDYILSILASYDNEIIFGKDELISLAESVEKAEKLKNSMKSVVFLLFKTLLY